MKEAALIATRDPLSCGVTAMPVAVDEVIREGKPVDAILQQIEDDEDVAVLVLGASNETAGPGPLVSALTSKFVGKLRVPVTIVPGNLSLEDVDSIA